MPTWWRMALWRWIKSELSPHLRTSHWHAADWAHGRVSNSFDFGQTQPDLRSFLGFAHPLRSVLPLCAYPSRFLLSCCGLGVRSGCFRFDFGRKQSGYGRLGLHPSLRSKLPCTPILRASCCHATAATRRAAVPTPFAPSGHFPLIGGIGPPTRATHKAACAALCSPSLRSIRAAPHAFALLR